MQRRVAGIATRTTRCDAPDTDQASDQLHAGSLPIGRDGCTVNLAPKKRGDQAFGMMMVPDTYIVFRADVGGGLDAPAAPASLPDLWFIGLVAVVSGSKCLEAVFESPWAGTQSMSRLDHQSTL